MTGRRVVALAQALAMIILLAPGPLDAGRSPARAAVEALEPGTASNLAFAAAGTGIGCQAGTQRYRGPREPGDPPWPPGAEPTPSPAPSTEPSTVPSADPSAATSSPTSVDPTTAPSAVGRTALLAAQGIRVAQAEASAVPTSQPGPSAAPDPAGTADDADIVPEIPTSPEASGRGRDLGLVSGIDISHHNGDIDLQKVRAAGNAFVFAKATQDTEFVDPMFVTNMIRARQAGLAAGGYHFFDYSLDGRDQADHFIDRLELAGALDGALPPVVDVECWAPIGSSIHAVSAARLRDFVARVYERTGRLPIIYTSVFMWRQVVGNVEGFEHLPLWAACWGCDAPPSIAPGWQAWDFWQTGVGRVPGVGRLDANYFSGDVDDLTALRLRPLSLAAGAPATARHQLAIDLGGRDATHLRTSPDGETWTDWSVIRGEPRGTIGREEGEHTLFVQLRNSEGPVSPVFSDAITLDRTGPEVSTPTIRLRQAPLSSGSDSDPAVGDPADADPADGDPADGDPAVVDPLGIPVEVSWEAVDPAAGLSDATLEVDCGQGLKTTSEAPGSAAPGRVAPWTAATTLLADTSCTISVIGRDGVGNETRVTAAGIEASVVPVADGGPASAEVSGDQVGIIARRGPDMGRAAVYLDGQAIDLVDLYQPTPTGPEIVHVADLAPDEQSSISIEATGTADPDATGTDVVIDAFVTLSASAAGFDGA